MKKKIAYVITKSNFGGAQRYVFDLATSLPAPDFDVVVILGGNGELKERLERSGIRTISLFHLQRDINLMNEFRSFIEFYKIFMRERPDIVHGNSSKAGGIASFIARLTGVPRIIFTAHAWAFNEDRDLLSKALISFLHWFNIILSDKTIAVSESVKSQVAHFPFVENKMEVVHLGIESPRFLSKEEVEKELGIPLGTEKYNIATLAELHPIKGLTYAIDALSLIRDQDPALFEKIQYFIFGQGDERERLEKHIKEKKLEDKIKLMGFKTEASRYLSAFDLFVLPSLSEALGYVLIESGFANIPIIASNVGGIPEVVENEVTGLLFPPRDAVAIKNTIIESYSNPEKAQNMAQNLHKKISAEFSRKYMLDKTVDIFRIGK